MMPPVFDRTVRSKTEAKVEACWRTFQQHHDPAVWEFVTWRDPLDPAEWPLTAKAWDKCANGAQYAGLIRLEALYKHGGFYIDSDVECLRSWETLRFAPAVAGWEDNAVIPDAGGATACSPAPATPGWRWPAARSCPVPRPWARACWWASSATA